MNSLWRLAFCLCLTASQAGVEAMLQYFNTSWRELSQKIPEIAKGMSIFDGGDGPGGAG
tara:strand:- start:2230 stop:2406 length:177 start_codon:yes stop_codon:yes gene_type:complete